MTSAARGSAFNHTGLSTV